jgi:RND superfamily putative drug exporter
MPHHQGGSRVSAVFEQFARLVVRFRFLVVAAWVAGAVLASVTLPSLGSQVNNDNSQFLPSSAPSSQAASLAAPLLGRAGKQSQVIIIAARPGARLTAADQAAIGREASVATQVSRVVAAQVGGISTDGRAAEILVQSSVNSQDQTGQQTIINALRATFARADAPAGLQFHLAGAIATNVANRASSTNGMSSIQSFSLLFIIVLLIVVFRSLLAALVTLIPSALALVMSMRFIGGLGAAGLKISSVTQVLLIVLLLGAGTDYGLFLLFRVREGLRSGLPAREAIVTALVRVGESISASAGTVILALLTLLGASFGIYHDLAVPLALGVAVVVLAGLTLLPALLAVFGEAVFWPARIKPGQRTDSAWGRVAGRAIQRPAITLAVGVLIFAGLGVAALGYKSSGFGGATTAPAGTDAAAGNALLAAHFPQTSANPADLVFRYPRPVWADPSALVTAERSLHHSGQFTQLAGPLDATGLTLSPSGFAQLHARLGAPASLPPVEPHGAAVPAAEYNAYRASAQFVSADGRTVQFQASLAAGGQQSTAAMNATPGVRTVVGTAARASGATASGLAGQAAALYDVSSTANHDLISIIPIAVLAIGLLLALVLRSLVAPLYLIVSVVLSYLAALGVSTVVVIDIAGQSGIVFLLPFLMFVFLLALGEDYNILVMTRIREEARHLPLRQAVVHAVGRTGSTVTAAGLILAGTFGVLALAGGGVMGGQLRAIGFGLGVGILMDTFLVRTLLVPSAVVLLGRWNWWPSPLSRRPAASLAPWTQTRDRSDMPPTEASRPSP